MEKEAEEELELLGAIGIVRVAFNILFFFSRAKVLRALALTLFLPLSAANLGSMFIFGHFFLQMHVSESMSVRYDLRVVAAAYAAFVFALSMMSTVTVVCDVASVYTANTRKLKLSYATILSADDPRVWKRLTLKFLCRFLLFFGPMVAFLLATLLLFEILPFGVLRWVLHLLVVLSSGLVLYLSMVLHLRTVIPELEENYYGLAALEKSTDLIQGKRMTAFALFIVYFIFGGLFGSGAFGHLWRQTYLMRSEGVGITAVYVTLVVGFLCFVNLMGLLTQSVLYFVCKSYHHKSTL